MARKRGRKSADDLMPPGARRTSSGRITITMRDRDGQRRSHSKIKTDEPETYATVEEAVAGFARVKTFLASAVDYVETVGGFFDVWTDTEDPVWGVGGSGHRNRGEHGIATYASHLGAFVKRFKDTPVAHVTDAMLTKWEREEAVPLSAWPSVQTFFNDAAKAGLRTKGDNPTGDRASNAKAKMARAREQRKETVPYVSKPQVDAMLTHLKMPRYPRSLYGWMLTGVDTGMRGAEIDGMEWEYLDGDVYWVYWQLHAKTGRLEEPKHGSRRKLILTPRVLEEIERQRATTGAQADGRFIWTNTSGDPWRQLARQKWWKKQVAGASLSEIVGERTMYEATRHHWASRVVNEGIMPLEQAADLYGHSDKGITLKNYYVGKAEEATLLDAMREAQRRMAA
jgi:integrase